MAQDYDKSKGKKPPKPGATAGAMTGEKGRQPSRRKPTTTIKETKGIIRNTRARQMKEMGL